MEDIGRKSRWRLWSGVIAIFVAGMLVGGLTASVLIRSHVLNVMRGGPSRPHERIAKRLTEGLGLTAAQRAEVERIVREYEPRFEEFERESRTEVRKIADQMEAEIRGVLTSEQQAAYDAGIQKMRLEWEHRAGRRHRR